MISIGETVIARMALEEVLARLSDEQEQKSLTEAVSSTIAGTPVAPAEGVNGNHQKQEERNAGIVRNR